MKKTALYARVSTDQQTTRLESQVRVLKNYCEQNEIKNYEIFMDEGISGTKSSRPALDRMMAAVQSGEVGSVVVYSFSRFARSAIHLLNALSVFKAKGKHIGRKKMRDSELIRKLLKAGLTYRRIAEIAKCSYGCVHAEKVAMKLEEERKALEPQVPETVFPEISAA